uniref:Ubiquitin-conjugating enzyme E2 D2B n=1 Tax=Cacopsylla melanoneura TaxID=428564 RepID=A0A8D8R509_9HEMI
MITPQTSSLQEDTAWRHFRLHKEYNDIKLDPPDGIQAQPLDTERCHWMATIAGPVASPYEGGVFYLYIRIPFSYPMHPPKVKFITRIFHPNVSRHGDVGIDCIQHNWSLALTLNKVLISVQSLLTDPYCLVSVICCCCCVVMVTSR